ncbi:S8 family serine peptidase [Crossiella sp. CA-258035]|uniref:S8 family serine peptidase n=1 Tax=Crossiella sp. CA-258035 TaxID=2981138 RepID=UPI0024BCA3B2|nr:S8 family serine peptidase [Crossiella sp. CA-258035]WHT21309.1 S8 family serine peptidase [Crossiella sp. CA-258035]
MNRVFRTALATASVPAALVSSLMLLPVTAQAAPSGAQPSQPVTERPFERLIVGYQSSSLEASSDDAAASDARGKAAKVGKDLRLHRRMSTGAAVVDLGGKTTKAEAARTIEEFRADPKVAYVEPDLMMQPLAAPNDTEYHRQWDLFEANAGMNVPGAWDSATGTGVTVAVIDTGYVAHSDLAGNIVSGYDFVADAARARDGNGRDSNPADEGDWVKRGECGTDASGQPVPAKDTDSSWHGTHVAGTIAASTGNSKGIAGIAYNAKIQPIRVLAKCGGATSDIADAINWASGGSVTGVPANQNPAKVINMSLGGKSSCSSTYQNAINAAVSRGTTVVVAAGNSNDEVSGYTPASCNNVISVAASSREGNRTWYSNYGAKIDVAAPGGETRRANDTPGTITTPENGIWATLNNGASTPGAENYEPYQGTSMAAPHIAGLAALMVGKDKALTPASVEQLIKDNARALPGTCTGGCGAGLADATKTVAAVGGTTPPPAGTFSNTEDVAIPDRGAAVTSAITVSGRTGNASSALKVAVDIKHTFRGDLVVDLLAPDGTVYPLKRSSASDSAADVLATYTVNASSEVANGTWKLRVQDVASYDTGKIDSWSLTF